MGRISSEMRTNSALFVRVSWSSRGSAPISASRPSTFCATVPRSVTSGALPFPRRRRAYFVENGPVKVSWQLSLRRRTPDHELVVLLDLGRDVRPRVLLRPFAARLTHMRPQLRLIEQLGQRLDQRVDVLGRYQQALLVTADDASIAMDVAAHDGGARCHRLEQHDAERFA